MRLVPLTPDYPLTAFDCGDDDLNKFLLGFYDGTNDRYFCGDFDGGGHTISGIRIYKGGSDYADKYQGLFGQTGAGANIHDVTLADIRITGYDNTGGIVGYNGGGTVSDCHVAADVAVCAVQSFAYYHGGIVGYNRGTVSGCTSAVTLSLTNAAQSIYYGGIAGESDDGTLRDNLAIGASVPATADNSHGAIVGGNYDGGTLERNYSQPSGDNHPRIGAQRAYFKIGDDASNARMLTAFNFNFGDEQTGIKSIDDLRFDAGAWYDMSGR